MNNLYKAVLFFRLISGALLLSFVSCQSEKEKIAELSAADNLAEDDIDRQIRALYAEGAEAYKVNCITCHSLRYIKMQPDFNEKTWQKIVDKMVKSFGAPIPDSTSKAIVKYLVAIKGKKE